MILVIGSEGNMGRRYRAVLDYLGKDWAGVDIGHSQLHALDQATRAEGVIIATPTHTHADWIKKLSHLKKPILCEKPITKDTTELKELLSGLASDQTPFNMVYQYSELVESRRKDLSFYNYFRHGTDGLYWDCIQIIGLARGEVQIEETSPIWRCQINGETLGLGQMDRAYIDHVARWLLKPGQSHQEILEIHEKTAEMERAHGRRN